MWSTIQCTDQQFSLPIIGLVRSPYAQKFAVPRQPGLAPHAKAYLEFYPPYNTEDAFAGLEGFSHLYVIFIFDKIEYSHFHATVRPPRLGGNQHCGVFASRSPFRPSQLGLSIVKLDRIEHEGTKVRLCVLGGDFVDKTPIVDVKPYIPFVDCVQDSVGGFAQIPPPQYEVEFDSNLREYLQQAVGAQALQAIIETLAQDPRPAYKGAEDDKLYYATLYDIDIGFRVKANKLLVCDLKAVERE